MLELGHGRSQNRVGTGLNKHILAELKFAISESSLMFRTSIALLVTLKLCNKKVADSKYLFPLRSSEDAVF